LRKQDISLGICLGYHHGRPKRDLECMVIMDQVPRVDH